MKPAGRYLGLRVGGGAPSAIDNRTCLVKMDVARKQVAEDTRKTGDDGTTDADNGTDTGGDDADNGADRKKERTKPTAFVGSVRLGQVVGRDAARVADEVIAHLAALPGADVEVSLEITVRTPQGVSEEVVRIVSENANALKFDHASFEDT